MVRAIKYLGIYRHVALPKHPAGCDNPRVRRFDVDMSIAEPLTIRVPASFLNTRRHDCLPCHECLASWAIYVLPVLRSLAPEPMQVPCQSRPQVLLTGSQCGEVQEGAKFSLEGCVVLHATPLTLSISQALACHLIF